MKASVIVTTHELKRFRDTVDAVASLINQTHSDIEVIVVVDRNRELYRKLSEVLPSSVRVFLSQAAGASAARNLGVEQAKGELVAFVDDDVVATRNWLSTLISHYKDPDVISVGGRINPLWSTNAEPSIPEEIYWIIGCTYRGYPQIVSQVRNNFAGNISFRTYVLRRVSFSLVNQRVDGQVLACEDTQLGLSILEEFPGKKILFDPEAIVYHRIYPYRTSFRYTITRAYSEGVSKAYIACSVNRNLPALSREHEYFINLITECVPSRVRKIAKRTDPARNGKYIALIFMVCAVVFFGYATGILRYGVKARQAKANVIRLGE